MCEETIHDIVYEWTFAHNDIEQSVYIPVYESHVYMNVIGYDDIESISVFLGLLYLYIS